MGLLNRLRRTWEIWQEIQAEKLKKKQQEEPRAYALIRERTAFNGEITQIKDNAKNGNLDAVIAGLETINGSAPTEDDLLSPEERIEILYTAGKNSAAVVYSQKGIDPANLAAIIGSVSAATAALKCGSFDCNEFLEFVHRGLVGDAKSYIRGITGKPNSAQDACAAVKKAEEILGLTSYAPEEKQEKVDGINRLLLEALRHNLKYLAHNGFLSEFENVREKFYEVLDKTRAPQDLRAKVDKLISIYRGGCHNARFSNYVAAFAAGTFSLEDLEECAEEHNRAFAELGLSEEDVKANELKPVARLTPNAYRIGINHLLCSVDPATRNGRPVPSKKDAEKIVEKVRKYVALAKLKPDERKGVIKAFKRIDLFYAGDNGRRPCEHNIRNQYKNPQYDRRMQRFNRRI